MKMLFRQSKILVAVTLVLSVLFFSCAAVDGSHSEYEEETVPFSGYTIPGTFRSTNTVGDIDELTIANNSITWKNTTYTILDGAEWSKASNKTDPLRYAYLITDGKSNYLCSVWYYVNNGKDYVKFNPPFVSSLKTCPTTYDYQSEDCTTGDLSKALTDINSLIWSVSTDKVSIFCDKTQNKWTVTAAGITWNVDFNTWVKNMDLSMPNGDERMEMEVNEGVWWSSHSESPNKIDQNPMGYYSYPIPTGTIFYELQCVESYNMYLLSVTSAKLEYDDEEDLYYLSYQILANDTLTKDVYDSLLVHFR